MSAEERAIQYERQVERYWQREAALAHEEREMARGPSAKPWAEPGLTIEERAARLAVEMSRYSWDGDDPDFRAGLADDIAEALRQARADAIEEAAQAILDVRNNEPVSRAVAQRLRELAQHILDLADAPAG